MTSAEGVHRVTGGGNGYRCSCGLAFTSWAAVLAHVPIQTGAGAFPLPTRRS